jgi:hypothetical protein
MQSNTIIVIDPAWLGVNVTSGRKPMSVQVFSNRRLPFFQEPRMQTAMIEYPDEVHLSLYVSPEQFVDELRMAAAAKLYEIGRLSKQLRFLA